MRAQLSSPSMIRSVASSSVSPRLMSVCSCLESTDADRGLVGDVGQRVAHLDDGHGFGDRPVLDDLLAVDVPARVGR